METLSLLSALKDQGEILFGELKLVGSVGYGVGVQALFHCYPFWGSPVAEGSRSTSSGLLGGRYHSGCPSHCAVCRLHSWG